MKKSILLIASAVCIYSFNSCKPKDESSPAVIGTDTSLMTKSTTSGTGDPSAAKPDASLNPAASADTSSMAKPNAAKKGKKGMVSLAIGENKSSGNEDMMDKEGYYTNVYPAYPGGNKELENFFAKNIQYPQEAADNGVEGTVNISFTVDEKGKMASPKVTSSKIGYGVEEEALRVFNKMPMWKPGALKGKNVKTRFNLPVRFQLEN
jgi:protein TonB